ncbi:MAG: gliding motility-associated C-terminal domain-containing protein [Sphingobacteriales bacterium]|nr:MAG: gliding motility-associated C-terminal domain-containing protein [Sphingobacteriales bacterium]
MKKTTSALTFLLLFFSISYSQPCTIPDSFFADDTIVVCQGSTFQLNAPVFPGATYTWSTAEITNPVTVRFNGKYWLDITDGVCSKSDTVVILFNSFLLSPIVSDLKLCKGQPPLPIEVEGQNLHWYTGPIGGIANTGAPSLSTTDTGRATYWFSQTIRGCESPRIPVEVKVIDKPKFDLGEAFIIPCGAAGITLQLVPDGESQYTWSDGTHGVSMLAPGRGSYSVYAENMCGNHRDTVVAVECEDRCVQFPTAFTPNSDGKNDKYQAACFCPVPEYKMVIYNRNGEIVFQTNDPLAGWDGFHKGREQPVGAYIFYSEYFDFILKQSFRRKGSFVLMR